MHFTLFINLLEKFEVNLTGRKCECVKPFSFSSAFIHVNSFLTKEPILLIKWNRCLPYVLHLAVLYCKHRLGSIAHNLSKGDLADSLNVYLVCSSPSTSSVDWFELWTTCRHRSSHQPWGSPPQSLPRAGAALKAYWCVWKSSSSSAPYLDPRWVAWVTPAAV